MSKPLYGEIQAIIGPMYSGKSTELLRRLQRDTIAGIPVILIKQSFDDRSPYSSTVSTHDSRFCEALKSSTLEAASEHALTCTAQTIAIDEGQFFPDIVAVAQKWRKAGKKVIFSALPTDSNQKGFGQIPELLLHSDSITLLASICHDCKKDAIYTWRLSSNKETILVGGEAEYVAVCAQCYDDRSEK